MDQFETFIRAADADVIGLQEVQDGDPERDTNRFMRSLGYDGVFMPVAKRRHSDGPAIFTKRKIISSKQHKLSEQETRGAIEAQIDIGGTALNVFSTHLLHTHQQQSAVQDEQVDSLIKLLPKERTIVMGDFNATPDSRVIMKISEALNNTDPSNAPTWSTDVAGCHTCNVGEVSIRLDYIFTSRDLKTHSPKVEQSMASDHLPISATLEV